MRVLRLLSANVNFTEHSKGRREQAASTLWLFTTHFDPFHANIFFNILNAQHLPLVYKNIAFGIYVNLAFKSRMKMIQSFGRWPEKHREIEIWMSNRAASKRKRDAGFPLKRSDNK